MFQSVLGDPHVHLDIIPIDIIILDWFLLVYTVADLSDNGIFSSFFWFLKQVLSRSDFHSD